MEEEMEKESENENENQNESQKKKEKHDQHELKGNYFSFATPVSSTESSIESTLVFSECSSSFDAQILRHLMALNTLVQFSIHSYAHEAHLATLLSSMAPLHFVVLHDNVLSDAFLLLFYERHVKHGHTSLWIVGSFGFLGTLEYHARRLLVLNRRSDHRRHDLMIRAPAPVLLAYYESCMLASLEPEAIASAASQFPLPVTLYHLYQRYQAEHGKRRCQQGGDDTEGGPMSFAPSFSAWLVREYGERLSADYFRAAALLEKEELIPFSLTQAFESLGEIDEQDVAADPDLSILLAIQTFCRQFGRAPSPEPSELPDFESESHIYLDWIQAYREQFEQDVQSVYALVGASTLRAKEPAIDVHRVRAVVKHCRHDLFLNTMHPTWTWLSREKRADMLLSQLALQAESPEPHLCLYVGLLLLDVPSLKGRLESLSSASESPTLSTLVSRIMAQFRPLHRESSHLDLLSNTSASSSPPICHELPIMASLMGGLAAQEIIQRITRQYVPMSPGHLLIWNGGYMSSEAIGCSVHSLYSSLSS